MTHLELNPTQLSQMLSLQATMNEKINPNWLGAGYPFLRAIVVEGAEAMDHYGWKWWKNQTMDKAQFAMELVDIWHFTLSHFVQLTQGNLERAAVLVDHELRNAVKRIYVDFGKREYLLEDLQTLEKVELLIGISIMRDTHLPLFQSLMDDAGLSWDGLYRQYVGKNVLNFFRQDHGYKEGTYRKMWNGSEDNEHLVEIMDKLDSTNPLFANLLYDALDTRYNNTL